MSDDRRLEKASRRQRNMESKFESIYHQVSQDAGLSDVCRDVGGDPGKVDGEQPVLILNVAELSRSKPPSSVCSDKCELFQPSSQDISEVGDKKKESDLLSSINRALNEGRKLRNEASSRIFAEDEEVNEEHDWTDESGKEDEEEGPRDKILVAEEEVSEEKELEEQLNESTQKDLPKEGADTLTERLRWREFVESSLEGGRTDKSHGKGPLLEDSLPLSASTCYRSPPSELRTRRVQELLDVLSKYFVVESQVHVLRADEITQLF